MRCLEVGHGAGPREGAGRAFPQAGAAGSREDEREAEGFRFLPPEVLDGTKACGAEGWDAHGGPGMRIPAARPLFAWDCLEDSPSPATIRQFLQAVPDERLLESLRGGRGKGRDDYPIGVCWGVLLLRILLRHPTIPACLNELGRNAALRQLIGIDSEAGVPKGWNTTRFLEALGRQPHLDLLHQVFDGMVRPLAQTVKDLGRQTAGDSSGLSCRPQGRKNPDGLPEPAGGKKEYTDEEGKVVKVHEWFGYNRCPAMHEGWKCPSLPCCTQGTYGKCVRVKRDIDLRRFPAIPRATKQFERLYRGRTAVERVSGRIKVFWGADDGNITGAARFYAFLGVVMVVHMGLATLLAASPRREGTLGKMRLSPIAKALQEKLKR